MDRVAEETTTYGTTTRAEQRVLLSRVSWETFERLLSDTGENRKCRFTYDEGKLEIMSPQADHERGTWLISHMIFILAEENEIEMCGVGALTCKKRLLEKGLEPDSCFYIANEAEVRGLKQIDLDKNIPPPDLMVEVDITRSSMDKLGICAALKVPEVWMYNGHTLEIHVLQEADYKKTDKSKAFPKFALTTVIPDTIQKAATTGNMAALREFRAWVKASKN